MTINLKKEEKSNKWLITMIIIAAIGGLLVISGLIFSAIFLFGDISTLSLGGDVAIIPVKGSITNIIGTFGSSAQATAEEVVEWIEAAGEDPNIKAIIVDINSPGGTVLASAIIGDALDKVDKPKVALIRDVGASGGYWVAAHTDYIIAHKYSVTGSIGVISSYPEFDEFLGRYNISYNRLVAGEYKDVGDPFTNLDEEKRQIIEGKMKKLHEDFLDLVVESRNLTQEQIDTISTAEYFYGWEAIELGLVDELGSIDEAKYYIEGKLNLTKLSYVEYRKEVTFLDMFGGQIRSVAYNLGQGIGTGLIKPKSELSYGN